MGDCAQRNLTELSTNSNRAHSDLQGALPSEKGQNLLIFLPFTTSFNIPSSIIIVVIFSPLIKKKGPATYPGGGPNCNQRLRFKLSLLDKYHFRTISFILTTSFATDFRPCSTTELLSHVIKLRD
jgi:hypothetical protein